uniref:Uncharacterized protein n=1 Tax=Anguilla anguilla TaxID=7936 RepID=A0A0E9VIJ8_ANGAN
MIARGEKSQAALTLGAAHPSTLFKIQRESNMQLSSENI